MMKTLTNQEDNLFRNAVIFSILFHLALWGSLYLKKYILEQLFGYKNSSNLMEIDLTKPFRIGGNPLLKPGGGTSLKVEKIGLPSQADKISETKTPPKEWVLPGPETKVIEKPVESSAPQSVSPQGIGEGTGDGFPGTGGGWGGGEGEGGGIPLTRIPKLLNRSEILRLLRRYYPETERQSGIEGTVVVDLHLGTDGSVNGVEVSGSAGNAFDEVALMVSKKMKFSPAMVETRVVAVKIRQSIVFKLDE